MRGFTPLLLTLLLVPGAVPIQAQTCAPVPPPFLPGLFPERAAGLVLQYASDPTGGCTGMYRPDSQQARASQPWAMVVIEANPDPTLGEDAQVISERFKKPTYTVLSMADWPVTMREAPLGDEFVAVKGSVRVMVLVKNGDHGEASQALARALMDQIIPQIPCG